jgi:hypothetical protein
VASPENITRSRFLLEEGQREVASPENITRSRFLLEEGLREVASPETSPEAISLLEEGQREVASPEIITRSHPSQSSLEGRKHYLKLLHAATCPDLHRSRKPKYLVFLVPLW